jgi:GTP-binding protein
VLAVNKWDLMSGVSTQREYARALAEAVPFFAQTPTVFVSARTGFNIRRSLDTLDAVAARVRLRLPTPALNRAIQQAVARVQPPMLHGKRLRVYYAAQVGTAPLRVALYVNDPNRLPAAYTQYLARCLRTRFDLHGAPLVLQPRHHREHRPAPSP